MVCPVCGAEAPEGARFCELDGTPLAPPGAYVAVPAAARCRCGAEPESFDAQGYCAECGRKRRTRDHIEIALAPNFGGVTDIGRRHSQNEDALALALESVNAAPVYVLVLCDGVSSSQNAQDASESACTIACDLLRKAALTGRPLSNATMSEAIRAANRAVCALTYTPQTTKASPETTLVAAVVQSGTATIGWVGDSRAYWIGAGESRLLTHDHSWSNDMVDTGQMTEEEAAQAPEAHAITRSLGLWEGAISEEAAEPSFVTFALPASGHLLLCSDGLWNYAPHPEQIAAQMEQAPQGEAQILARTLVEYANVQGGRDNITVAIVSF